jgi:hypothetical protein
MFDHKFRKDHELKDLRLDKLVAVLSTTSLVLGVGSVLIPAFSELPPTNLSSYTLLFSIGLFVSSWVSPQQPQ